MLIEVTPSQSDSFFNISNNVTTLLAAVNGSELGLRGDHHMCLYNVHSLEMMKTLPYMLYKKIFKMLSEACNLVTAMYKQKYMYQYLFHENFKGNMYVI